MIVGVPQETFPGERRVALVPGAVAALKKLGANVLVQRGAGTEAGCPDDRYEKQGARLTDSREEVFSESDLIVQVRACGANPDAGRSDLELLRDGQILIGVCEALAQPQDLSEVAARNAVTFALDLMPRITRAQSMDILSSMATIAGYKAVLLAANALPRMFPMLMTAAGTVTPAKVFVVGAGVAGLQAIATAKRLGSVVQGYDIRPAVKEQVESVGGQFVELELEVRTGEAAGGYAREMGEDFYRKQREMMQRVVADSDAVITTAAVPGKKAPVLVTGEMVHAMKPGSVVVDLAAERGGNCELTKPGETVVERDVQILGPANLPSEVPFHASQMFSNNVTNFLKLLLKEGQLEINVDDEIISETLVTRDGEVIQPRIRELLELPPLESGETEGEERAGEES